MEKRGDDLPEKDPNIRNEGDKSFLRVTWGSVRRAILGSCAAVMFGVAILVVSIFAATNPLSVYPHESGEVVEHQDPVLKEVQYYLPYPGVLPDNPLYKLKAVRDRVVLWITLDGEKKARKELLYSDKRINAAIFLLDGGKEALAVTTATKAEKYLESSINRTAKLSSEGKDMKNLLMTLITASAKHLELLETLQARATGSRKNVVATLTESTKVAHDKAEQALVEAK